MRSGKGCVALDVCYVRGFVFVCREERVGGYGVEWEEWVKFVLGGEFRALLGE